MISCQEEPRDRSVRKAKKNLQQMELVSENMNLEGIKEFLG